MKIRFAQLYAAHAAFNRYAAIILAENRVQSGGGSLPRASAVITLTKKAIRKDKDSPSSNFFEEINFFVEHQNKFCQEFVEYVFSAWARGLQIDASSLARTSVNNQI